MRNKVVMHLVGNLGFGGAQSVVANTCDEIQKHTEWTSCILPLVDNPSIGITYNKSINILKPVMHRKRYYARTLKRISNSIAEIKPDILHLHLWEPKLLGVQCLLRSDRPAIITTEHNGTPWGTSSMRQRIDKWLSRRIDHRIMVCEYIENLFIQSNTCSSDQSSVIYNPVSGPIANQQVEKNVAKKMLNIHPDTLVFLFVGTLRKVKNLSRLLNAYASFRKSSSAPNSVLIIVGNGPELSNCRKQVNELGIQSSVGFELGQSSLSVYYNAADIFVMTSESEGMSIALAEAMLHKIVPICADTGGTAELVKDGETGFLLDSKANNSDSEIFLKVANSPHMRLEISTKAEMYARRLTNPSNHVSNLIQLYETYT